LVCELLKLKLVFVAPEPFVLFLYFIVYFFPIFCAVTCLICMSAYGLGIVLGFQVQIYNIVLWRYSRTA